MSKQYTYEVAQVGEWDAVVVNEDNEPLTGAMSYEDACELRWKWLSQEERDEITLDFEVDEMIAGEDRANRLLSCDLAA